MSHLTITRSWNFKILLVKLKALHVSVLPFRSYSWGEILLLERATQLKTLGFISVNMEEKIASLLFSQHKGGQNNA